jgi:polyhydroxyalkanoate synthesis regulator phasin
MVDTSKSQNIVATGAIYKEIARQNTDEYVIAGDLSHELTKSLVDDLNKAIESKPYGDDPFYILVHEKKDLKLSRIIMRTLHISRNRPYPEDDTVVFYVEPKSNNVKFCWSLPHETEMDNILMNFALYDKGMIEDIKAWKSFDLGHFGFYQKNKKVGITERNRDKLINSPNTLVSLS